jgi:hypothetical protein
MEEANSLGLSRGDGVECYMTYLKRRDQVKMMGLGQRAKVLLLHSHVGNISTRTFPLELLRIQQEKEYGKNRS